MTALAKYDLVVLIPLYKIGKASVWVSPLFATCKELDWDLGSVIELGG